jgi:redox-sensitive bicupin YhaK (pirin superfamily)
MALPTESEECEPDFAHYPADDLPEFEQDGVVVRVILGEAYGHCSPVATQASPLYLECRMPQGSALSLPTNFDEIAVYVVSGGVDVDGQHLVGGLMAVACPGKTVRLSAATDSHVMVIGGVKMGERHIWWNLVSSSKERIEQAKEDWKNQRFDTVPGEKEFIPLPNT